MDNISRMTIDESSSSMYFSFNSTAAYKGNMESAIDNSLAIENEEDDDCDLNNTLEAEENTQPLDQIQTIKKQSIGVSPLKAIPKNILKAYKALSSTPTKSQLMRSVEVNRGSAIINAGDLGLAFLEAPQECITDILSEDKENQPQESQEIICSETSSEIVSVIEKTQEEEVTVKKVGFSNLPVLKRSGNSKSRGGTPKVRRSIPRNEPDLNTNRPSRIVSKRMSCMMNPPNFPNNSIPSSIADSESEDIPKMLSSILKISKGLPTNKKSLTNIENPFNLLGKATRMSIVKTTLNSPARKASRKSVNSVSIGRNPMRASNFQVPKAKSIAAATSTTSIPRRSVLPTNYRKSVIPTSVTSPKKKINSLNSRKSMMLPITSKPIPSSTSDSKITKKIISQSGLKDDLVCEVCSRKFLVLSLFEAHKKTHNNVSSTSTAKQTFSSGNNNKCRYCDKKFAIKKALDNHLIQNCTKIPPGDKKKLLFPTLQQSTAQSNTKLPSKPMSAHSSCDSLSSANQLSRSQSNNKLKQKLAHSGVYCTPNKQIICHLCKSSFNNILAFTEHQQSHLNAAPVDGNKAALDPEPTQNQEPFEQGVIPLK